MTKWILAGDPGKKSGVVILQCSDDFADVQIHRSVELDEQATGQIVEFYTDSGLDLEVVFESFVITTETGKKKDTHYSLELIGVARYFCTKHRIPFTLQPPSLKQFAPNDMLRDLGFWVPGGDGHAHDAMRHAIVYLIQQQHWRPKGLYDEEDS